MRVVYVLLIEQHGGWVLLKAQVKMVQCVYIKVRLSVKMCKFGLLRYKQNGILIILTHQCLW